MLKTRMIVLNVKTYTESTGLNALELTRLMGKIAFETNVSRAIAVQASDLSRCSELGSIPVYAQHIDPIKPGSNTGWTLPEAVKQAGAVGTLINHSEHRLILADIDTCILRAKDLGLETLVCTNNVATSKAVATFSPAMLAVEPPELIGGDISVTTADPSIVRNTVQAVRKINRAIYRAATEAEAEQALRAFEQKWDRQYPSISKSWRVHWPELMAFMKYPAEIRQAVYTTNAIESLNRSLHARSAKIAACFPMRNRS